MHHKQQRREAESLLDSTSDDDGGIGNDLESTSNTSHLMNDSHNNGSDIHGGPGAATTMSSTANNEKGATSTAGGSAAGKESSNEDTSTEQHFAKKENERAHCTKFLLYAFLLLSTLVVASAAYYIGASDQRHHTQQEFHMYGLEILQSASENTLTVYGHMGGLSTKVTQLVNTRADLEWPFVNIPDFHIHANVALEYTGAEMIIFAPVLEEALVPAWENYTWEHRGWIREDTLNERKKSGSNLPYNPIENNISTKIYDWGIPLHDITEEHAHKWNEEVHEHFPSWQVAPVPQNASIVNLDLVTIPRFENMMLDMLTHRGSKVSSIGMTDVAYTNFISEYAYFYNDTDTLLPRSNILVPVLENYLSDDPDTRIKGFLVAVQPWHTFFNNLLPDNVNGLVVVLNNTCKSSLTFEVMGRDVIFLGPGDLHDPDYEGDVITGGLFHKSRLSEGDDDDDTPDNSYAHNAEDTSHQCVYYISVYSSKTFEGNYRTNEPAYYAGVVCAVFLATMGVFMAYDCIVTRRQQKYLLIAERTNAIVQTLFPKNVQQRMMHDVQAEEEAKNKEKKGGQKMNGLFSPKQQLEEFLGDDIDVKIAQDTDMFATKPIADLFPETTIMYADLVGFTAWSSMREPTQVFTLLETIYHAFDEIARRRAVFKVETIGDCYVAVCGLPQPCKDHAVVMVRFANECLEKLHRLTKKLELALGPDTTELGMRFGLHSGPVTAGVLRGERARFQLFGDSVVTAAIMEHKGTKNMIHLSAATFARLKRAGKEHWLRKRDEMVEIAEGKKIQTYWVGATLKRGISSSSGGEQLERASSKSSTEKASGDSDGDGAADTETKAEEELSKSIATTARLEKHERLIDWVTDVLASFLKQIEARRRITKLKPGDDKHMSEIEQRRQRQGNTVLEEVVEVITLPKFEELHSKHAVSPHQIQLSNKVLKQLREYVQAIAHMYKENPFHNFEHASHVTMSVTKLLSRIVAPDLEHMETQDVGKVASTLHDHTYGITSDPLTQFAVVFSALIHDVDHPGVPNMQLVKERTRMASAYKGKSVAEQNSVDIAWDLIMDSAFTELRRAIYATEDEFERFRQLVVNVVMATDIMDKDLGAGRKARWEKAFSEQHVDDDPTVSVNRKATIVIEHLIQASDIAHTMQHWHIYRKWNTRFFEECCQAYADGRSEKNPAEGWYKGEIGFYDFYIIPLAKKLKDCGVFGVSSDEYLNYAMRNREQWAQQGEELVASMVENLDTGKTTLSI